MEADTFPTTQRTPLETALVDKIHISIGQGISNWQNVETALYVLTHVLLGTENRITSTVYFHNNSFDTKLKLVDKLCNLSLGQSETIKSWVSLHTEIIKGKEFRNHLAHWEIQHLDVRAIAPISRFPATG